MATKLNTVRPLSGAYIKSGNEKIIENAASEIQLKNGAGTFFSNFFLISFFFENFKK